MNANMTKKITKLLVSNETEVIGGRFRTKVSEFNNGNTDKSIMIVVSDLLDSGFTIKFFNKESDAASLLKLLGAVD